MILLEIIAPRLGRMPNVNGEFLSRYFEQRRRTAPPILDDRG